MPSPRSSKSSAANTTTFSILRRSKTATLSLRACLALGAVFLFMVFQLFEFNTDKTKETTSSSNSLLLYYAASQNATSTSTSANDDKNEQQQEQDSTSNNNNPSSSSSSSSSTTFLLETFALSFDPTSVERLQQRNQHSNLGNVLWVHGVDGLQQRTLNLWAQLTNHGHAGMSVEQARELDKSSYESPHAVGCYLSHWNLLRMLAHRPQQELLLESRNNQQNQQHAYLILEDDATCAPGLDKEIERTIQQLPSDWDLLFVGGKPFSYFDNSNPGSFSPVYNVSTVGKLLMQEYRQQHESAGTAAAGSGNSSNNNNNDTDMRQRIRHAICQGAFGTANGPLAPDGSRKLLPEQAYWRVDYLTNTHSYVVNPQRIAHVAKMLHPTMDVPIDIRLADLMKSQQLQAYMTTRMWCDQTTTVSEQQPPLLAPQTWSGFFVIDWNYLWQTQMHIDEVEDCAF
jgi:hypothetical protein